jgi:diguanylate cyclase (GGDEF)-like protein/PAS domain S-box-containing protein
MMAGMQVSGAAEDDWRAAGNPASYREGAGTQARVHDLVAELRWRLTMDQAPTGIALVGLDGRWLRVNPALCRILGYTEDELMQVTFQQLSHPDDLDEDLALVTQLINGQRSSYSMDKRYFHADGHQVWTRLSVGLVRDPDSAEPLYFVSHIHDVTEQRRTTHRLAKIIAGATDAFIGVDHAGLVTEWNTAAARMFGYSIAEALGRPAGELIISASQQAEYATLFGGNSQRLELTCYRKDGMPIPVEVTVWQADDASGESYALCRDMTDKLTARFARQEITRRQAAVLQAQQAIAEVELSPRKVMQAICERAQALTDSAAAGIEVVEDSEMVYRAVTGILSPYLNLRLRVEGSISGLAVMTRTAILCNDTADDPRVNGPACARIGAAAMIVAPLRAGTEVVGVLKVIAGESHHFDSADLADLELLAAPFGAALANAWQLQASSQQALTDPVTGLANRVYALHDLARALDRQSRHDGHTAVLFIDLDRFKAVNDTHGHTAGDQLLLQVANRLRSAVRTSDTPVRYGGDEFLIICDGLTTPRTAEILAHRLLELVPGEYELAGGTKVSIGVSIGVAVATAPLSAQVLLDAADEAMYESKHRGGNAHTVRYLAPESA